MTPPRLARWLLRRSLPDDHRDLVIGELDEEFARVAATGRRRLASHLWYWSQVLTSLPGAWRLRQRRWRFGMTSDVRFALRRLGRTPVFTAFAVLTLALGVGATTGIYSAVRAAVGPPPGVANIDRIVNVYHAPGGTPSTSGLSLPDYEDLRARQTVFNTTTAWAWTTVAYSADGQSDTSFGEIVGGDYFALLGVTPARGRLLQPADDRPDAPPAVVISHATWRRIFAGDESVVGRAIKVNGHAFQVVGVASPEFRGLFNNGNIQTALWLPIAATPNIYRQSPGRAFDPTNRESRFLLTKGLLKPGKTIDHVRAELGVIAAQLDAAFPIGVSADPTTSRARPGERDRPWDARLMSEVRVNEQADMGALVDGLTMVLMLAVGAVLMVACTNLANLALARSSGRRQETAVRLAIAASRWRLVRESLVESTMLAVAGGILGLGVARVIVVLLSQELNLSGTIAVMQLSPRLDAPALLVAAAATALALVVAGLGPALQSTRSDVRTALVGDGSSGAAPRWRGRRYLIAMQVTVSVVLLALAALGITQLRSIHQQDYGFALPELGVAVVDFENQGHDDAAIERVVEGFLTEMRARPEATSVTVANGLPAGPMTYRRGQIIGGSESKRLFGEIIAGTADLVPTLGLRITHGRSWDATDAAAGNVAIIDAWTANALFGATNVVGRDISVAVADQTARSLTVIGVVADTSRGGSMARGSARIYVPFRRDYDKRLVFAARTTEPAALVSVIQQTLRRIEPDLVVQNAGAGPDLIGSGAEFFQISSAIATVLGAFAWVLALGGLYGVLSHLVVRRTREIGVRIALGATRADIVRMIVRQGLSPVVLGVVAGLLFGAVARLALQPQFLRLVPAMDVVVLGVVPVVFIAAAIVACYLPARRAASVDPMVALRRE
jgi:predicted permease